MKFLLIGSGASAQKVFDNKNKFRAKYDKIIISNQAIDYFEDIADYWMVMEAKVDLRFKEKIYYVPKFSVKRVFNRRLLKLKHSCKLNTTDNVHLLSKVTMNKTIKNINFRKFVLAKREGLLAGPEFKRQPLGTVLAQMIHYAMIDVKPMVGASQIDIIGCELFFPGGVEHFYKDNLYSRVKDLQKGLYKFVKTNKGMSNAYFVESAKYLRQMIQVIEKKHKVPINILCDSLIK